MTMSINRKVRLKFILITALALAVGLISYPKSVSFYPALSQKLESFKINLGLDLQGGIHLEYRADVTGIPGDKVGDALQAVQDVIERRVNAFGVGEPLVQTALSGGEHRIIVELPGIKDVEEAKEKIKDAPLLEFREAVDENNDEVARILGQLNDQARSAAESILEDIQEGEEFQELARKFSQDAGSKESGGDLGFLKEGYFFPEIEAIIFNPEFKNGELYPEIIETEAGWHIVKKINERLASNASQSDADEVDEEEREVQVGHIFYRKSTLDMFPSLQYKNTGLTGRNLKDVQVTFPQGQGISEPQVSIEFDDEGTDLFAEITKRNVGKPLAIFLDGEIKDAPTINEEITGGKAVISGNFNTDEAARLKSMINEGVIALPLELVGQQSIEASLGMKSLEASLRAGTYGLLAVAVFMIAYYRLFGVIASISLLIYAGMMISIFKLSGVLSPWPITLTLSGIAGFILSVGMAVDANILIFERTKEEIRNGRGLEGAIEEGFKRAWTSIRDGNYSTIITSFILIYFGTGFIKGFAIILVIGVFLSMFTAIVLVRNILRFIAGKWLEDRMWLIIRNEQKARNK